MAFFIKSSNTGAPDTDITVNLDGGKDGSGPAGKGAQAVKHMISIDPADSTAGTVTVTAQTYGGVSGETVFESDGTTPLSIDLSDVNKSFTRKLEGYSFESITFSSSGMDGAQDWTATVNSGD